DRTRRHARRRGPEDHGRPQDQRPGGGRRTEQPGRCPQYARPAARGGDVMSDLLQRARAVKLAIFDVDGVLTDGRLYFLEDGSEFKTFNTLDGHGIKMLIASGVRTAIISGRKTPVVERRANNLGIQHLFQGREDKLVVLDGLLAELGLSYEQVAYLGDDLPDLPV